MTVPFFLIDAFTAEAFTGNAAAVVVLDRWLADDRLQAVAAEMRQSETAFLVKDGGQWQIRWFTPTTEIDLCGHATLASAYALFERVEPGLGEVVFHSPRSGGLPVRRADGRVVLDFPAKPARASLIREDVTQALRREPRQLLACPDAYVAVFDRVADLLALQPDMAAVAALHPRPLLVTAPGEDGHDFASRCFYPSYGIPEDPVTGSAHCVLTPFWAKRLGKSALVARQLSRRGGTLWLENQGERVLIGGRVRPFVQGQLLR